MINVAGFNSGGTTFSMTSCPLIPEGDPVPIGPYTTWMPYQAAQAHKEANLTKAIEMLDNNPSTQE